MRGAQPATSAGARLFAGSPIPALLTAPQKGVKKSILSLDVFPLQCGEHVQNRPVFLRESKHLSYECAGQPITRRWICSAVNIPEIDFRRTASVLSAQECGRNL